MGDVKWKAVGSVSCSLKFHQTGPMPIIDFRWGTYIVKGCLPQVELQTGVPTVIKNAFHIVIYWKTEEEIG